MALLQFANHKARSGCPSPASPAATSILFLDLFHVQVTKNYCRCAGASNKGLARNHKLSMPNCALLHHIPWHQSLEAARKNRKRLLKLRMPDMLQCRGNACGPTRFKESAFCLNH